MTKRILVTPGEPAGIGPDITIQIAQSSWPAELVVIADPDLLLQRAEKIGLPLQLLEVDPAAPPEACIPGAVKILPVPLRVKAEPGRLDVENAGYVIQTLETAASMCTNHLANALATGPVHKGIINQAGVAFTGHTEFFAQYCHVPQTVMFFVVDNLKVALVTTHIPLANVSQAITREKLQLTLSILNDELKNKFKISSPRILVCGVNPHAGEGGYLGREEIDVITPLINDMKTQGMNIKGPLPADTVFTQQYLQDADAVLAMYHDQALPLVKYAGFGHAVNVTLGLPFLRTSVDHGTAIDIAGTKKADAGSMDAAIKLAIQLG